MAWGLAPNADTALNPSQPIQSMEVPRGVNKILHGLLRGTNGTNTKSRCNQRRNMGFTTLLTPETG